MGLHVYNTLILSDLHLGAETSHAREATSLLKEKRFERLILLGDIFADLNFARLTKDHWKFLGCIRKLSNPKRGFEVISVRLSRLGTSLYLQLQKLDFKSKPIVRMIDRLNTRWLRMSPKVSAGAISYAKHQEAQRIFCGHTHQALHVEQNTINYNKSSVSLESDQT